MSDWDEDWDSEPKTAQQPQPKSGDDWGDWETTPLPSSPVRGRAGRGRPGHNPPAPASDFGWSQDEWNSVRPETPLKQEARVTGNTLTIYIPASETGRVIGRAGSTVQEIQSKSGARVKIHRDSVNGQTQIDITGFPAQRDNARALIEEKAGIQPAFKQQKIEPQAETQSATQTEFFDWDAVIKYSAKCQDEKWAALPPIVRNFYIEHPEIAAMSLEEAAAFREANNNILVQWFDECDQPLPKPCPKFEHAFESYPEIMAEIQKNKFTTPSPIQAQGWPVLMQGIDLIGIAQTGTGKTLCFLLPAMIHIDKQTTPLEQRPGPTVLIIAPTRELALQLEKECQKYSYKGYRSVCIYGGVDREKQIAKLKAGVEIVIATPGRLNDLWENKACNLTHISYLVLDEADRMLDQGFEREIKKFMIDVRPDRHTVLTSATWPDGVQKMASQYLKNAIQINVESLELNAVNSVEQRIVILNPDEKTPYLENFIQQMKPTDKVIVFIGRKDNVDTISSDLACKGVVAQSMHGNRDQSDREQALKDLKTGEVRILLATDVASRGLDVQDITHVLSYDFPRHMEEYVHRVGRTGRAGRTGVAITLVTREDWKHAEELIEILKRSNQYVPQQLVDMAARYKEKMKQQAAERAAYGSGGRGGRFGGSRRDFDDDFGFGGGFSGRRPGGRF